jgi:alpha-L-rhamnosidase
MSPRNDDKWLWRLLCLLVGGAAQVGVADTNSFLSSLPLQDGIQVAPLRSSYLRPTRIVWQSESGVRDASVLLKPKPGQTVLSEPTPPCQLTVSAGVAGGVLLDFGVEIQGTIEIFTPQAGSHTPAPVRVRFGESASEAMADIGNRNAQNDHAVRDETVVLPWLGKKAVGPSGFRFVRLDAVAAGSPVSITQIRAVLTLRDLPWIGSFRCNDERLNRIWQVGAYTVQLNMQDYLWDGIKRDRLVWLGDMYPEVSTINAVFGECDVVPKSLDLIRDVTPPDTWMNGISSYSMWWVLIQEQWWLHHGNRVYLEAQKDYLSKLVRHFARFVDENGAERLDGMRFLDWPTSENQAAIHEGLQALMVLTMESGKRLATAVDDKATAQICEQTLTRLRAHAPEPSGRKSPAALLALAGVREPKQVSASVLTKNGPSDLSTYYGFFVLQALAESGDTDTALDFISTYWGAMLDYGATTFWEDFDLSWTNNAGRIDELVPAGKKDLHGDCGAYCYKGFRHSLCHGWASGPTAWLSERVLGIIPLEPGFSRVAIKPQLGRLKWVEGAYPTPLGPIKVRHERRSDGTIKTSTESPPKMIVENR